MALTPASLQQKIITAMEAQGAKASGEHSWVRRFAEAIASAVVAEIQENAEVPITGGSSAGTYKVR